MSDPSDAPQRPEHAGSGGPSPIDVVVVGAATRDLTADDPRGWRLGGPVTYASLTLARLGLRVAALIGADEDAATAWELDILRGSGMALHLVLLRSGPVFENRETPKGRVQRGRPSDPMPPSAARVLGTAAAGARGWFLAPVASELGDSWAAAIPPDARVALGWQGLLRTFEDDGSVSQRDVETSPLVVRADLVGVGSDDLKGGSGIPRLVSLISPRTALILTHGADGGLFVDGRSDGQRAMRWYPAVAGRGAIDVTGAGDTFLAALFAARLEPRLVGGRGGGFPLLLAASAASLVVEAVGLAAVPDRSAIRDRMREGLAQIRRRP